MSFARLVLCSATVKDLPTATMFNKLPPREEAAALIQDCVRKVFTVYPFVAESIPFAALETAYQHDGRYCTPQDTWNLRLVLAIAYLGRSAQQGDDHYMQAVAHMAVALTQREAVLQPGSVNTVQALLLLVIYSLLDPAHFDCWYLVGVAARLMVDIGLHQELQGGADSRLRSAQIETRRCVYYSVYALDRQVHSSVLVTSAHDLR
jgi:hypothetical protein